MKVLDGGVWIEGKIGLEIELKKKRVLNTAQGFKHLNQFICLLVVSRQ